jgi:catechol 2,3-dioxygenase-like lactoylglutathione lyase family enzyme
LHLDRSYDSPAVRDRLLAVGIDQFEIQRRGTKLPGVKRQPLRLGLRWVVEATNTWWSNYGQLRRNTDRRARHRHAAFCLATAILIVGRLIDWRNRWSPPRCAPIRSGPKARLRPMRGLKHDRSTKVIIAGHAFVQNVRRGHYELALRSQRPGGWRSRSKSWLGDLIQDPGRRSHALGRRNATAPPDQLVLSRCTHPRHPEWSGPAQDGPHEGPGGVFMATGDFPAPSEGFVLTHFIVAEDVARSRDFYTGVLGGKVVLDGEPTIIKLANGWVTINVGGGPTDDKPEVVLAPPSDLNRTSAFLNIRVADIQAAYQEWSARGAEFLTPPKDHGFEIRCYMRDPDGHLIEVGQTTGASRDR